MRLRAIRWLLRHALMTCRTCGHHVELHTHHRPGSDCAVCRCPRFR